jgi:hypothetical protein
MMERDGRAERSQEELDSELQHSSTTSKKEQKRTSSRRKPRDDPERKERRGPDDEHVIFGQLPPHAAAQLHGAAMALAFQRCNIEVRNEATLLICRTLF